MKKTTAVLLALLLAASTAVSLLTSCNKTETEKGKEGEGENGGEPVETDPLAADWSPNVPTDLKFEGQTFGVYIGSVGGTLYAEEENSNLLNDIAYRRNKNVEDHFGITLNIVKSGYDETGGGQAEATAQMRSLIENGDTTYHMFTHVQHTGMPQMILEHYFVDWNTIPYINLSDEWWYQNIKKDLCFGNKVYLMAGDYTNYLDRTELLVFNKDIFNELDLEYPYQDVLDGTWTMDKFEALIKQGAKDLDGNGIMEKDVDRWGLVGWGYEMDMALLVASGYSPLEKDADDMPILPQNIDENHAIYQRIVDIFADGQYAFSELSDYSLQNRVWNEGRAMFKDAFFSALPGYAEVEFDFGIIPYPKWEEGGEYYSRSANTTAMSYIPVTNQDLEFTGAVLDELAFLSAKELTPAFYDTMVTVKGTRDVESEDMLPIIKDSARFLYAGYDPGITGMVDRRNNTYSSTFNSNLATYQQDLEEMRELLLEEE